MDPHEKATNAIMRLRRPDHKSLSTRSSSLSRVVLIRKEIGAMMDRTGSTGEVVKRDANTKQTIGSSLRTLLRDVSIASKRLELCIDAHVLASGSQMTELIEAWKFAAEVYNQLLLWPSIVSPESKMRACVLPVKPPYIDGMVNREGQVYVFPSLQYGAVYGAYQCSCIHMCQSLRMAHRFIHGQGRTLPLDSEIKPSQDDVLATLDSAVADIFGTSPFMLGDINSDGELDTSNERRALGAFFLLRSVYVALSVDNLAQPQLRKLLGLLGRIGSGFGIKTASNRRQKWLAQHPGWA